MKRFILLLLAFLLCLNASAQKTSGSVTLKNGTTLTGVITEIDPASHIKMNIAGVETTIKMQDVQSIEGIAATVPAREEPKVAESSNLPETYMLKVGPYEIEMLLVRGGQFAMGYDGPGSRDMRSEPVHDVILSDFYVNREPIAEDIVNYLTKGTVEHSRNRYYSPRSWKSANNIAQLLAKNTDIPVQLITEAQWEYIATGQEVHMLTLDLNECNYCFDFLDDYVFSSRPKVDPKGPQNGSTHVLRSFRDMSKAASRALRSPSVFDHAAIRVTIPAAAAGVDGGSL